MSKKAVLIILDGYGLAAPTAGNAVAQAKKPNLDKLFSSNPYSTLSASGLDVGLPAGQMGNSEVGHTNMGAGRVVFQILPKMTQEIENGKFFQNAAYIKAMEDAKANGKALHIMGLMSTGGVHSHLTHVFAILDMAKQRGVEKVYVHCFLDGRDVAPKSGAGFVAQLNDKCKELGNVKIATIQGRFWGMDRDKRWDRVEKGYNAIVCGEGVMDSDPVHAVEASYANDVTDEFVEPVVVCPEGVINKGDSVIFMNFRPDRAREMTWALNLEDFDGFERKKVVCPLSYVCTAQYDETLPLQRQSLVILRETAVQLFGSFCFLNGGVEKQEEGEDRCLVPSPKEFPTYDLVPQMSAAKVADKCIEAIASDKYNLIVCNFANCDMVGHTGVMEAAVKAVETVDTCMGRIMEEVAKHPDTVLLVTADHGNAECMFDENGKVNTAHTTNLVPFTVCMNGIELNNGKLADIAPTILQIMGLKQPEEMTGVSLIK